MSKNSLETLCSRRADPLCGGPRRASAPQLPHSPELGCISSLCREHSHCWQKHRSRSPNTEGQGLNEPAFLILKPVNDVEALKHHPLGQQKQQCQGSDWLRLLRCNLKKRSDIHPMGPDNQLLGRMGKRSFIKLQAGILKYE